jgi:RimJ/RimL family protein N-acetyltransferase
MPWALTSLGANEMRMAFSKGRNDFDEGKAWNYGLFWRNSGQLVESAGLHGEDDRDCPEIGYSIRTDRTQKGWATESARALVETVFTYLLDVKWAKICVDQANVANAAVPRKLGSHLARVGVRAIEAKSLTGKVFVWLQRRFDAMVRAD